MKAMLLGTAILSATIVQAHPHARLQLHAKFNESEGIATDSSPNHLESQAGTGLEVIQGKWQEGVYFNGIGNTPGVLFKNMPSLMNTTVCMWINVQEAGCDNNFPRLLRIGRRLIQGSPLDTVTHIRVNHFEGTTEVGMNVSLGNFTKETWHHLALLTEVAEDKMCITHTLYVDGKKTSSTSRNAAAEIQPSTVGNAWIGNEGLNDGSRPFGGGIDDVRVYDGLLTPREIAAIYNDRLPVADAGEDFKTIADKTVLFGKLDNPCKIYPDQHVATSCWTQVSGPVATIARDDRAETEVALPEDGTYVFRLNAVGLLGTASDEVTIVRDSSYTAATPAIAFTESSTYCYIPGTVDIGASASSGRITWSKASGPGEAFFDDAHSAETKVTFTEAGDYVLAITADNGFAAKTETLELSAVAQTVPEPDLCRVGSTVPEWTLPATFTESSSAARILQTYTGTEFWPGRSAQYSAPRFTSTVAKLHATVGNGATLPNLDGFTVATWINFANYTNMMCFGGIAVGNGWQIQWQPETRIAGTQYGTGLGTLRFMMRWQRETKNSDRYWWLGSKGILPTNEWVHVAVSIDRTKKSDCSPNFYVNGVKRNTIFQLVDGDSTPDGADPSSMAGYFYIGNMGENRHADALFDDFRMYSRVLTDSEVRQLARDTLKKHRPIVKTTGSFQFATGKNIALPVEIVDDGNDEDGVSATWSVASGNASGVTFDGNTATFSKVGNYVLKLTVQSGMYLDTYEYDTSVSPAGTVIMLQGN